MDMVLSPPGLPSWASPPPRVPRSRPHRRRRPDSGASLARVEGQELPVTSTNATPMLEVHLKDHSAQASAVRDAVIAGDRMEMRAPATWLSEHKLSDSLPSTRGNPMLEACRTRRSSLWPRSTSRPQR